MNEQELQDLQKMLEIAVSALEDVKAKDIAVLETQEKTPLFARMIIASGDSTRQVRALVNNVAVDLKAAGFEILSTEGQEGGEWALVDAGDLVVHVMLPAVRDYYDIDTLWGGEKPSFHPGAAKPWHAADSQS
ncbi:ribosome silencing factor [Uruburuella suis]|jgi:ribosome-associated protein|uniref:Ribosomal silencing factor RsfS n=1 Tax=Uruburuella suis TaxID=252130 RepID=A0AAE9KH18_9NEIS|nr:ribosome silencing factor [Uruburuella suis]MBP7258879.1 ribosome silencing factor [Neisseria sp.]TCP03749.1 ribosome-associated protein [Uruburuella suis]UOO79786.1 ribosome silencing factor [Uruburuella suis]HRL34511.1 ribosome silencing factor [Neisseria sp.]